MIIDFHSHFLPSIDDGAPDVETSIKMVNISKSQNVNILVATPHFDIKKTTPYAAVLKRSNAYKYFKDAAEDAGIDLPLIKLGFEVRNSSDLLHANDLDSLCIEGTKTILLEMPMSDWHTPHFENVEILIHKEYNVVIAHLERYIDIVAPSDIGRLLDLNVYSQVTSSALLTVRGRQILLEMLENDMVHLLGSDAHNTVTRSSFMDVAYGIISANLGQNYINKINSCAFELLNMPQEA